MKKMLKIVLPLFLIMATLYGYNAITKSLDNIVKLEALFATEFNVKIETTNEIGKTKLLDYEKQYDVIILDGYTFMSSLSKSVELKKMYKIKLAKFLSDNKEKLQNNLNNTKFRIILTKNIIDKYVKIRITLLEMNNFLNNIKDEEFRIKTKKMFSDGKIGMNGLLEFDKNKLVLQELRMNDLNENIKTHIANTNLTIENVCIVEKMKEDKVKTSFDKIQIKSVGSDKKEDFNINLEFNNYYQISDIDSGDFDFTFKNLIYHVKMETMSADFNANGISGRTKYKENNNTIDIITNYTMKLFNFDMDINTPISKDGKILKVNKAIQLEDFNYDHSFTGLNKSGLVGLFNKVNELNQDLSDEDMKELLLYAEIMGNNGFEMNMGLSVNNIIFKQSGVTKVLGSIKDNLFLELRPNTIKLSANNHNIMSVQQFIQFIGLKNELLLSKEFSKYLIDMNFSTLTKVILDEAKIKSKGNKEIVITFDPSKANGELRINDKSALYYMGKLQQKQ